MNTEKNLKSRFGSSSGTKDFEMFGADIEFKFPLNIESNETKIVNFHEEVMKIKNKISGCAEQTIENNDLTVKGKRKKKKSTLTGMPYDDIDEDFIDDSEAFEVMIPENYTTVIGGFYVNKGPLKFIKNTTADKSEVLNATNMPNLAQVVSKQKGEPKSKNIKKSVKTAPENLTPETLPIKGDINPEETNYLSQSICTDTEIKNHVDKLLSTKWTIFKDIEEVDFVKESFINIANHTLDTSKKDKTSFVKYIASKCNISLANTLKYIKQAEKYLLKSKIEEIISVVQKDLKESENISSNYLAQYVSSHLQPFGKLLKYQKKLLVMSNIKESQDKYISDIVSQYIAPLLPSQSLSDSILQLLQKNFYKPPKKMPQKSTENHSSPQKNSIEMNKEIKEILTSSPPKLDNKLLYQPNIQNSNQNYININAITIPSHNSQLMKIAHIPNYKFQPASPVTINSSRSNANFYPEIQIRNPISFHNIPAYFQSPTMIPFLQSQNPIQQIHSQNNYQSSPRHIGLNEDAHKKEEIKMNASAQIYSVPQKQ